MLSTVLPTGAAEERSVTDLLDLATRRQRHVFGLLREGACPFCYGQLSVTAGPTDLVKGDEFGVEAVCTRCGQLFAGDFEMYLSTLPAVASFYADHDRSPRERHVWELRAAQDERAVTAADDGSVRYRIELGEEALVVTVDRDGTVASTRREAAGA
jgi:hypothetical protein